MNLRSTKLSPQILVSDETIKERCQGDEPLLVHANVTQLLVHDGVDVGSGGNLPLEQGWSQLGLELDLLGEN